MARLKMNRFHWHLSDDQGWRVEIKKYPKLTTIGATAPNSFFTDMESCTQYWINKPYGPYFYTQEEIKDVVAYAKTQGEPAQTSGKQELYEAIVNMYC